MTITATATLGLAVLLAAPPETKPVPKFKLSKETTYITEPLDKDGYLDYETALNERLRGKTTPETNAVVLLMQAIGPRPEGKELHADWWKWLGAKSPPETGEYLVSLDEYRRKKNGTKEFDEKEYEREINQDTFVRCRPWTRQEFAFHAEWLDSIEKPLEYIARAATRPDFYSPMVHRPTGEGRRSLMGAIQLWTSRYRVICQALCIRSMLRLGRKEYDGAWSDLAISQKISLLLKRSMLTDHLIGIATEIIANESARTLLSIASEDGKRIARFQADVEFFHRDDSRTRNFELIDRFMILDGIQHLHATASLIKDDKKREALNDKYFDKVMKDTNANMDRVAKARRLPTRMERLNEFARLRIDLKVPEEFSWSVLDVANAMGKPDRLAELGPDRVQQLFVDLYPAYEKIQNANERAAQLRNNLQLSFALAEYRADVGSYPRVLDDLVPKYLAKVPDDVFTENPPVYKTTKDGYVLYSFGANGKDDGGHGREDDPAGDDLVVRMPLPEFKRE